MKIVIDRAVVEQALHALNYSSACISKQLTTKTKHDYALDLLAEANDALRASLAQPQVEQEPVAWTKPNWQSDPWATAVMDEQKKRDVARNDGTPISKFSAAHTIPLYTNPQPHRQPLTDDEIEKLFPYTHEWLYEIGLEEATKFARSIEHAHGIKEQK